MIFSPPIQSISNVAIHTADALVQLKYLKWKPCGGLFEVRSRHFDVIRVIRQCIIHIARDEGVRYIVLTNINMRGSRCPYFQSKNICRELLVVRARNYWGIDNRICTFSFVVNAKRSLARRVDNFIYRLIPLRLIRRCQEKI